MRTAHLALTLVLAPSLAFVSTPGCGSNLDERGEDAAGDAGTEDAAGEVAPFACGEEIGPELDLLPVARLRASETRPHLFLPYPVEDEGGIATVRDDVAETTWQPPEGGGEAEIEIDLLPALGRPVRLDRVELTWSGGEAPPVTVVARPACGLESVAEVAVEGGAGPADVGGACAGCVVLRVEGGGDAGLASIRVLSTDPAAFVLAPSFPAPSGNLDPTSGVVEGFYGRPWSWDERRRLVTTLAHLGLGAFLYGPKDDPYHRDEWRTPWPPAEEDALVELADFAAGLGVGFVLGLAPFVDLDAADPADVELVASKLTPFVLRGVTRFALLADDIELEAAIDPDEALGAAHVEVVSKTLEALRAVDPAVTLWFVPTVYSDARLASFAGGADYLEELKALPEGVPSMWTGTDVFSPTLAAGDLEDVTSLLGAPPLLWDNYWANDIGRLVSGRLGLAPLRGRDQDLRPATAGILQNPLVEGAFARLAVSTFGLSLSGTAEEELWQAAATLEATRSHFAARDAARDAALLVRIAAAHDGWGTEDPISTSLDLAASTLEWILVEMRDDFVPRGAAVGLLLELASLASLATDVHHSGLLPDLADELTGPLARTSAVSEFGFLVVDLLAARYSGDPAPALAEEIQNLLVEPPSLQFQVDTTALEGLANVVLGVAAEDLGFVAPGKADPWPESCRRGVPLVWQPFSGAYEQPFSGAYEVDPFGLPGATVDLAGAIHWTPPHGGRFDAWLVGSGISGWRLRDHDFACEP